MLKLNFKNYKYLSNKNNLLKNFLNSFEKNINYTKTLNMLFKNSYSFAQLPEDVR